MGKLTAQDPFSSIAGSDIGYFVADPSGTPDSGRSTIDVLFTGRTITTPTISGAMTFPDNVRQTFNPGATVAGLNVGSHAGDPSTPINGDLWYDSTANELTARINGASVALGAGGGGDMVLASVQTVTGAKQFGTIGGAVGKLILAGATSGSTTLNSAAIAGSLTLTLPAAPSANASPVLVSTAGVMSYPTGTPNGLKFLRDDGAWTTISGGGDALVGNPLSQFVATTSAQLAGVLSDETGFSAGALAVFSKSPIIETPTVVSLLNLGQNGQPVTTTFSLNFPVGVATSSRYAIEQSSIEWTDGGAGSPYVDETLTIGIPAKFADEPQFNLSFESKFRNSSTDPFQSEMYFQWISPDNTMTRRPWMTACVYTTGLCYNYLLGETNFSTSAGVEVFRLTENGTLMFTGTNPAIWATDNSQTLRVITGGFTSVFNTAGRFEAPGGLRTDAGLQAISAAIGSTYYNVAPPADGLLVEGLIKAGSAPTTLTDSAGKILSAALNTVAVAQGGTGLTSFGTGVATWLGTPSSANLRAALTDENGTGAALFDGATSPTFVTPALGTPSALVLTSATGLPPVTGIAGWPANASGVLNNDGAGVLSWGAGGGTPTVITVADTTDTTAFVALFESATGDLGPKTDAGLTYNAGTGLLTATGVTVTGVTKVGSFTTTQRDALTPADGMILLNTTLGKFQGRAAGAWVDLN